MHFYHFPYLFFLPPPVLPALPCSFSDLPRAVPGKGVPLSFWWKILFCCFFFFFGSAVYHPIPDPFFPVVSSPPEHKCHFGAISSAGTPHILTLFKIGIIKGFGYSSGCFSWFLGEVGEITCGQFPHSYQEPDGSHVFLI